MDLLFVSARPPGPGDPRTAQIITGLAERGHTITLVCGATHQDTTALNELRRIGVHVHPVPATTQPAWRTALRIAPSELPFAAGAVVNRQLVAAVQSAARTRPNAVAHLVGHATAPLGVALRRLPAVIDLGHCAGLTHVRTLQPSATGSALFGTAPFRRRAAALFELSRTRRYEAHLGAHFERVIVATPTDAWALRTLAEEFGSSLQAPIRVLANGVDLHTFAPQPVLREANRLVINGVPATYADAALTFIGAEVMPRVWQARADVHLTLVGVPISPAVRALARDPRVTLLPSNADPRTALAQATIAVIPPCAPPGVPTAALEALAMGTPVVAATAIAQHTALRDGHDLLLADDGATYAHALSALLDDPGYRGRLGRAGRRYVEQHHNWGDVAAEAEQIYAAAMGAEIADWRLAMGLHRRMPTPDVMA